MPSAWIASAPRWLEEDEVKAIVNAAFSLRDRAMLQTAYDLALRVSEVCLLNRRWFSFESKTIKVLRLKRKGFREDILPVGAATAELLRRYLGGRIDGHEALFVARSVKGVIDRISHDAVNYAFRRARVKRPGLRASRSTF